MRTSHRLHADRPDLATLRIATAILCALAASISLTAAEPQPVAKFETRTESKPESNTPAFTAAQLTFFEKEVHPILVAKCLKCHGAEEKIASEFSLTSRAATLRGGELGSAVDLKNPAASSLLKAIHYDELQMPPSGKLPPAQIAILTRWVKEGLPYPKHLEKETAHVATKKTSVTDEDRNFWAYQPVAAPQPPAVKNGDWLRNPVDAFILSKLEAKGIAPSAPADKRTLIRRATYDLTGLPPSPEEVDAFLADDAPNAYEKLLDKLLASPHYGEKWGRHWLDLVRYAESHGYERDSAKPFAWRYRDYVIDSFNRDKPYDTFLREQLAGDELDRVTPESLIATGYYRLGVWDDEPADRDLARYDVLDGIASTTANVVLGMSVGCARCHDHKRDPIPQRDYYKFLAFFSDVSNMNRENLRHVATRAETEAHVAAVAAKAKREAELYADVYALEQRFLAEAPLAGVKLGNLASSDIIDLTYQFYRDTWKRLPDFDQIKPERAHKLANNLISLSPASRPDAMGLLFEAGLQVPKDGAYTFHLTVTEGARLLIDGKPVIAKYEPGRHVVDEQIELTAGLHKLRFEFFNRTAQPELNLAWSGPGFTKRALSDDLPPQDLNGGSGDDTWMYTVDKPEAKNWNELDYRPETWKRGPAGFGTRGVPGGDVKTEWRTKQIWLRKKFNLTAPLDKLTLDVHHDEDVEIYLNGELVFEAKGHTVKYERIDLDEKATKHLKPGVNLMAVTCKQTGGGQYIDVKLADGYDSAEVLVRKHGEKVFGKPATARYLDLVKQLDASRKTKIPEPGIDVMAVVEAGRNKTHILLRGMPQALGDQVTPGIPEVLAPGGYAFALPKELDDKALASASADITVSQFNQRPTGRRRALAEWLIDKQNPLTARVFVNRLWQYHFGRGLVATSNDFGKLGELPTHPELLDWLAAEFMRGADLHQATTRTGDPNRAAPWSIKAMHKLLMLSNTYRLSSQATDDGLRLDPADQLYWRFHMRRLAAEEVRDSILAVTGQLNKAVAGPSVYPAISAEVLAGQSRPGEGWPTSNADDSNRRSVYVHVKRSLQLPILAQFDQADTDSSCAVRYVTTVPTQSLSMLNGQFIHEQAAALAKRLEEAHPNNQAAQIRLAIRLTTQRIAAIDEIGRDIAFVQMAMIKDQLSAAEAMKLYCLMVLNTNEFFYLD
jgi:hypothetical protein